MKKMILTLGLIIAICGPAYSEDFCETLGEAAESIMEARQNEAPMGKILKIMTNGLGPQTGADLMNNMVIAAYEHPAYYSKDMQRKSIARFKNKILLECYKAKIDSERAARD